MKALLLIDIQNDFFPGGSLTVPKANEIIPLINECINYPFDIVIASKDWHSFDHGSFAGNYEGKKPGEHIQLGSLDQILWPRHCVQGTWGAEFAPGWEINEIDKIIYKGTNRFIDSYSTFYDNGLLQSTGLEEYLKDKGVKEIFMAGLTIEYCVNYSVLDALKLGFRPYVIVDACRGINLEPHDTDIALSTMRRAGAILISCKDLKGVLNEKQQGLQVS